jgi:hypothetical protein
MEIIYRYFIISFNFYKKHLLIRKKCHYYENHVISKRLVRGLLFINITAIITITITTTINTTTITTITIITAIITSACIYKSATMQTVKTNTII